MRLRFGIDRSMLSRLAVCGLILSVCGGRLSGVTSRVTRHGSSLAMLKGETENIVIGSRGTIGLGQAAETLVDDFGDVWSINSMVVIGDAIYIGTSPNGGVYEYTPGGLKKIYPPEGAGSIGDDELDGDVDSDANTTGEPVDKQEYLTNEHIFAMGEDSSGRLLVGIGGAQCNLSRLEKGKMKTLFEPDDAKYIFAITTDKAGNIYLGTGPEGKVYKLNSAGKKAKVLYDSSDKNILSLVAGGDGMIYAGSDTRGLIYRIDGGDGSATVLYDSDQPEITALLADDEGGLYAASTTATMVSTQTKFAAQIPSSGRPDVESSEEEEEEEAEGDRKLEIANTDKPSAGSTAKRTTPVSRVAGPARASYVYRVTKDGFVTDIYHDVAVFFALAESEGKLLLGTGNKARLVSIDSASEEQAQIFEDEQASQITAIVADSGGVLVGTANPAKLLKLTGQLSREGTYISDLVDAGQPANWGKLQIKADIPDGCEVLVSSRSGNVKDVNDPTFSKWSKPVAAKGPVQLRCPMGRFCQYKLTLKSGDGLASPVIREIAVASTVPNLAPKILTIDVARVTTADKAGTFKISYKGFDINDDTLVYRVQFRKAGRSGWIELKKDLTVDSLEWDARTVEDGRYELRASASDERSNTSATKLTGSRISDSVVVDNTGPVFGDADIDVKAGVATLTVGVSDAFSAIGQLDYTVDSNADWVGTVPTDLVYDTTQEDFEIVVEGLESGEHVIAMRATDAVGNRTYKTFEVEVKP